MNKLRIRIASIESLADEFAREFTESADAAVAARGRAVIAVPGGSVAERFLPRLGRIDRRWDSVDIFWCDERAVPIDDPASNAGMAARLLAGTAAAGARTRPMPAYADDLAAAAERYAGQLRSVLGANGRLDLALLGLGEDGHVASLFPGHPALRERAATVAPIYDAPKPPARRMTLTLPVLAGAHLVILAAFGPGKATAVRDAVDPAGQSPAALVIRNASRVVLLVDPEAGLLLDR